MNNPYQEAWEAFNRQDLDAKVDFYNRDGRLFDVIVSQQFDREILDHLCKLTTHMRLLHKTERGADLIQSLLRHKRAMLYFVQPSTRTFLSFLNACQILGMDTSEIRDTATSSEVKGESPEDTIRTFSSYVDLIITRHPGKDFSEKCAWVLNNSNRPTPVLNGGSGQEQHPTQALLDIYTLQRSFEDQGGIDGKTITFVGDLKRGRTVRSLTHLMKNYRDVRIIFASPEKFRMRDDIKEFLDRQQISFKESDSFREVIPESDAIYMTRIQDEHDDAEGGKSERFYREFSIGLPELELMKKDAIIMHPLPRRNEIDVNVDADSRAMYWRQERNGMWMRAALITYIFHKDEIVLGESL